MQGQLSDKPLSTLIRALAHKNASGLLRLSRGKTIKAIFFESGAPTFAISNVAQEQLDYKLVRDGRVTQAQIDEAKQHADKANKLGATLVERGALSAEQLRQTVQEQVKEIILSLFTWEQGEYIFDERMRAVHEIPLTARVTDLLLEGARQAADNQQFHKQVAPTEGVVVRASLDKDLLDSGKLMPIESYVLSRIESPTVIGEVGALSGLPDEEAQRAICALVASGFLRLMGDEKEDEVAEPATSDSVEKLREDIARKLNFYSSADFYEILEIGRQATTGEIKAAYYQLAKKYHPDRYRQAEHAELRGRLENLFAKITEAYETLSNSGSRSSYDLKLRKSNPSPSKSSAPVSLPQTTPLPKPVIPTAKTPSANLAAGGDTGSLPNSPSAPLTPPSPASVVISETKTQGTTTPQSAEFYYQQGRARLDRKDYHAAVHMLREAVKIDSSKAIYHFHLGVALIRNPRTRRDADTHLAQAAELDKYNAQLRVKLGMLYKETGLKKRAEHYFKEALSLDPDNRAAQKELGAAANEKREDMPSIWKSDMGTIAKRLFKR